jgi:NDP-sugar pyrophosphorylase family protein
MMLVRCGALADLSPIGFVDFKEQGLPILALRHRISVLRRAHAGLLPIRTAPEYLAAVRGYQQWGRPGEVGADGIVEAGARVESSAMVYDAVVLGGGTVGAGAVVARSIICEGATVPRGQVVVNQIVTGRHAAPVWLERPRPAVWTSSLVHA